MSTESKSRALTAGGLALSLVAYLVFVWSVTIGQSIGGVIAAAVMAVVALSLSLAGFIRWCREWRDDA